MALSTSRKLGDTTENIIPLPSEGRGRTFESYRVRQPFQALGEKSRPCPDRPGNHWGIKRRRTPAPPGALHARAKTGAPDRASVPRARCADLLVDESTPPVSCLRLESSIRI